MLMLLHAYHGAGSLRSLPPSTCTAFLYVRSDNDGSDVCASRECPGETMHLPRLV